MWLLRMSYHMSGDRKARFMGLDSKRTPKQKIQQAFGRYSMIGRKRATIPWKEILFVV